MRFDRWMLYLGLPLLAAAFHWQIWGMELRGMHVWRQAQTQQAIDAFALEDFNILNPKRLERGEGDGILRLEFPLYQWITAALAKILGNSIVLSRLIVFLFSFLAAIGMHRIVLILSKSRAAALIGAYFFMFSPLVFFYGISVMPDMLALCLCIWGLYYSLASITEFSWKKFVAASFLIGLGALVKLPFIVFYATFLPILALAISSKTNRNWRQFFFMLLLLAVSSLPMFVWYLWVMSSWGPAGIASEDLFVLEKWQILKEILAYHFVQVIPRTVVSIAMLPFVVLGIVAAFQKTKNTSDSRRLLWPILVLALSFFSFWFYALGIIGIAHDYYFFPLVAVLIPIGAIGVKKAFESLPKWTFPILILILILVPYMAHRRVEIRWSLDKPEFNYELFQYQTELRTAVPNDALVVAGPDLSHMVFLYYIDKKGWSWDKNQGLSVEKLKEWRARGAKYLYCDDRNYDTNPSIAPQIGEPIKQFGRVRIYQLLD